MVQERAFSAHLELKAITRKLNPINNGPNANLITLRFKKILLKFIMHKNPSELHCVALECLCFLFLTMAQFREKRGKEKEFFA